GDFVLNYFKGNPGGELKFTLKGIGSSTITITVSDDGTENNTTTETFQITVVLPTGTESGRGGFSLYPNPVKSAVNLDFKSEGKRTVKIYNAEGILVGSSTTTTEKLNVDTSSFRPGLYFIEVLDSRGRSTSKIVKE